MSRPLEGRTIAIEVMGADGRYRIVVGGDTAEVDARSTGDGIWSLLIGSVSYVVDVTDRDGTSIVASRSASSSGVQSGGCFDDS